MESSAKQYIFSSPVVQKRVVAQDTWEVTFGIPSKDKFSFLPGQNVRIILPESSNEDTRGNRRKFSVLSSPNKSSQLSIAFRSSESEYKKSLVSMPLGTHVTIEGPFGSFLLPKKDRTPLVFIAGGIGIAPFISMLRYTTEEKLPYVCHVLYANKTSESMAYLPEIRELVNQNERISFTGSIGRMSRDAMKKNVTKFRNAMWYIAGPTQMVLDVEAFLQEEGVVKDAIMTELFSGYEENITGKPCENCTCGR